MKRNTFKEFLNWIVNPEASANTKRKDLNDLLLIKSTNYLNLCFIAISALAIVIIVSLSKAGFIAYIRYVLLIGACGVNLLLNRSGFILLSKILTILNPFLFIYVLPLFTSYFSAGMFLWVPYGILVIGSCAFMIFSYETEKYILNPLLVFFAVSGVMFDKVLHLSMPPTIDVSFIFGSNYFYYTMSKVMFVLFLYIPLYISKIQQHKTRQILITLNKLLYLKNEELNSINSNLEDMVKERTTQLNLENSRIKELTFTNSHKVRAYTARIIGLVNLMETNIDEQEKKRYYNYIRETALDLDEETQTVSKKLNEKY